MQRKKGDGSFRRLPNNSFEFTVSVGNDIYGSRQRKFFYGKTESECRKKYKEFLKGGEKTQRKLNEYTVSTWLEEWLRIYKQNKVEASTYKDYCYLATHVRNHKIGKMKLSYVKSLHITEYFTSIIGYSSNFRKKTRFLLNGAFEAAIDNDFCVKNPVRRAEIAKKPELEKEPFTEDEARTIIEFAKTDEIFGVPVYIMLNTGIRSGELRALTADKIDFENGIITIDKAVKRTEELGKPKNSKTRHVPLKSEVLEFLREKVNREAKYIVGGSHYVTSSALRCYYEAFFKRMNTFLESTGEKPIPLKSPHATRHTCGTLLQKNGMPIVMVMELLGHSSLAMTEKYTHFGDISVLAEAVRKYDFITPLAE
jgi:integrase